MDPKKKTEQKGHTESDGRREGLESGGGVPLNTPLEDGQLRGVDEDGQPTGGTHGGPHTEKSSEK
jgi:hypothetical protein